MAIATYTTFSAPSLAALDTLVAAGIGAGKQPNGQRYFTPESPRGSAQYHQDMVTGTVDGTIADVITRLDAAEATLITLDSRLDVLEA